MNLKRREFIRLGGITVAGSMVIPTLFNSCKSIPVSDSAAGYMDHFEVSPEQLQKLLATALGKGADYADLYFEHTVTNATSLQDKKVNSAYSDIIFGVGIRVLKGDQTGFAYSENTSMDAMLKAARTAASIADSNSSWQPAGLNELIPASYYKISTPWEEIQIKDKIPFITSLNDKIFAGDTRVTKVNISLSDSSSYILFCNSEGVLSWDYRPLTYLSARTVMEENGRIENGSVSQSFRRGFEFLTTEIVDKLSSDAIQKTSRLFKASKPKAGEMEVVMAAGSSGILLHEAMGHSFEADFNRKNTSIFSDKMGRKIAENFVTVVDDGTLPNDRGALNIDDEGVTTEKTILVNNGVLTSYIHDRISAKHYNVNPTGNGRRQDFRNVPIPRMRSTYMENGPHKREEIIDSVKKGIFVEDFSNGQVNIGPGDFTFFVKFGYIVENGKITKPIKDINIIGNGPQALADITMVADDMEIDHGTWTCGKDGQGVPVSMGLPTVKIKKLTVGGLNA
ncbi:MAG: peptidase U62 [Bacteroidetes bacterium GWE2_41_25]|nr:MAG: peptidase U62 [Bacteroidetes bacterium GWA2_40_15]OFX87854.1 MAG: peptidase U62 [Bacteroidetes bacterium GWC2_40_22]OFX98561.1 MAG: peptidase U62 [Bacteroidetes bacterium GWE2_41_25]HBH85395.1 peptidase U62 [Bacteroidales bacterium]HBQ81867.1 peptidase U62 [Bacteroidales bacterium]